MFVYIGDVPQTWNTTPLYWYKYPNAWRVDYDRSIVAKDGLHFAVEANILKPHNSRNYQILKREALEEIFDEAKMTLYFRDLEYRGLIKTSRLNLEHALERVPALLATPNQRFRIVT